MIRMIPMSLAAIALAFAVGASAEQPFFPRTSAEIEALLSQPAKSNVRIRGLAAIVADPKAPVRPAAVKATPNEEAETYQQLSANAPKSNALVHFDLNSATIRSDAYQLLNEYAKALKSDSLGDAVVIVAGHTDDLGSGDYNLRLSIARAEAVKSYLVSRGVDAKRLVVKGYGENYPIAPNNTSANRALNRRSEFIRVDGFL